jgi:hypothetical protein
VFGRLVGSQSEVQSDLSGANHRVEGGFTDARKLARAPSAEPAAADRVSTIGSVEGDADRQGEGCPSAP